MVIPLDDHRIFLSKLINIDLEFQLDGATPYFANDTIGLLRQKFSGELSLEMVMTIGHQDYVI